MHSLHGSPQARELPVLSSTTNSCRNGIHARIIAMHQFGNDRPFRVSGIAASERPQPKGELHFQTAASKGSSGVRRNPYRPCPPDRQPGGRAGRNPRPIAVDDASGRRHASGERREPTRQHSRPNRRTPQPRSGPLRQVAQSCEFADLRIHPTHCDTCTLFASSYVCVLCCRAWGLCMRKLALAKPNWRS